MKIDKTGRDTLKSYFVKNAVPTASNFEDLVNGTLNQRDDGIAKLPGEPLSLQADGDDTSQKKLLNFYRNFNDVQPAWTLALSPRADPRNPSTGRAGLGITDGEGVPRLFIDQASGFIGAGTVTPAARLHLAGNLKILTSGDAVADPESRLKAAGSLQIKGPSPQIDFIDNETGHGHWALHVNNGKLYFIREPWNHSDLVLDGGGRVGMGCVDPQARLEVRDGAIMPSFGNSPERGIRFPSEIGGGKSDSAWMRYYVRSGEACTLEIGCDNDDDDHIALMPGKGGVGIGTNNPTGKLHVQTGGAGAWDRFIVNTTNFWGDNDTQFVTIGAGGAAGIMLYNPHVVWYAPENRASIRMGRSGGVSTGHFWDIGVRAANIFSIVDANTHQGLSITEAGVVRVSILQLGDKWRFSAVGDAHGNDEWLRMFNPANNAYSGGLAVGKMHSQSGIYQTSDLRNKRDIHQLDNALGLVSRLRGVRFQWKDAAAGDDPALGLIAQEVERVLPEAVSQGPDGMKSVNYAVLVAPLIEAVKQQQAQIEALAAQLARLAQPHALRPS